MSFRTSREIAADPASVFAAFADSARLAVWWGPAGFSNTIEVCEFAPGGTWRYVMHGPNGKHYRNESVFRDIRPGTRIVIDHRSRPRYLLTIDLEPATSGGTVVRWEQAFKSPKVEAGLADIVVPANEQNLDRLTAEVLHPAGGEGAG